MSARNVKKKTGPWLEKNRWAYGSGAGYGDSDWWRNYTPRPNADVKDIYAKISLEDSKEEVVDLLLSVMSAKEVTNLLDRLLDLNKRKFSDVTKAKLLHLYPHLKDIFPPENLARNTLLALLFHDFDTYIEYIDVNELTRKQIRLFLDAVDSRPAKYLAENMLPERMKEIFTVDMWQSFLGRFPKMIKNVDITRIPNQTELRNFILNRPHVMRYATLDDMKNCSIKGPTWVRIITKMTPKQRGHIPAGFREWAEKDIFKEMLKGKKFKNFKDGWSDGLQEG